MLSGHWAINRLTAWSAANCGKKCFARQMKCNEIQNATLAVVTFLKSVPLRALGALLKTTWGLLGTIVNLSGASLEPSWEPRGLPFVGAQAAKFET